MGDGIAVGQCSDGAEPLADLRRGHSEALPEGFERARKLRRAGGAGRSGSPRGVRLPKRPPEGRRRVRSTRSAQRCAPSRCRVGRRVRSRRRPVGSERLQHARPACVRLPSERHGRTRDGRACRPGRPRTRRRQPCRRRRAIPLSRAFHLQGAQPRKCRRELEASRTRQVRTPCERIEALFVEERFESIQ